MNTYQCLVAECRSISTEEEEQVFDAREEPDGEETATSNASFRTTINQSRPNSQIYDASHKANSVKVPDWISSEAALNVLFNDRANSQIAELNVNRVGCLSRFLYKRRISNFYFHLTPSD